MCKKLYGIDLFWNFKQRAKHKKSFLLLFYSTSWSKDQKFERPLQHHEKIDQEWFCGREETSVATVRQVAELSWSNRVQTMEKQDYHETCE